MVQGEVGLDVQQTPREESFCSHAMENDGVFVVPDAQADTRFAGNPLVTDGPHIRFTRARRCAAPTARTWARSA